MARKTERGSRPCWSRALAAASLLVASWGTRPRKAAGTPRRWRPRRHGQASRHTSNARATGPATSRRSSSNPGRGVDPGVPGRRCAASGRARTRCAACPVTASTPTPLRARERPVAPQPSRSATGRRGCTTASSGGDGRVGYAPFVLRRRRLGEHRVAMVMPTNTWFAYNSATATETAKATPGTRTERRAVDTTRPFLDRGVPPHFGHYDLPFLRWLFVGGRQVDMLSQRELETSQRRGAGACLRPDRLPGPPRVRHRPRVRRHRAVPRPRRQPHVPLGQQLLLQGRQGRRRMTRAGRWRDLGRPEAALSGSGSSATRRRPRAVRRRGPAARWIFAGTGRGAGSHVRKVRDRGRRTPLRLAEGDAGAGGDSDLPGPARPRR